MKYKDFKEIHDNLSEVIRLLDNIKDMVDVEYLLKLANKKIESIESDLENQNFN